MDNCTNLGLGFGWDMEFKIGIPYSDLQSGFKFWSWDLEFDSSFRAVRFWSEIGICPSLIQQFKNNKYKTIFKHFANRRSPKVL